MVNKERVILASVLAVLLCLFWRIGTQESRPVIRHPIDRVVLGHDPHWSVPPGIDTVFVTIPKLVGTRSGTYSVLRVKIKNKED